MKILYLILIPFILFGQHFTENGNNKVPDTLATGTTQAMYVFDDVFRGDTNLQNDFSSNAYNLDASAFSAGFADELASGSVIYNGGNYLTTDAVSEKLKEGGFTNIVPGASAYTLEMWVATNWATGAISSFMTLGYAVTDRIFLYKNTDETIRFSSYAGGSAKATFYTSTANPASLSDNELIYLVVEVNPTTSDEKIYINGTSYPVTVSTQAGGTTSVTDSLFIGGYSGAAFAASNWIYWAIHHEQLSQTKIKERYALPRGWHSKQGEVVRDAAIWNIAINGTTLKAWVGSGTAQTISVTGIDSTRFNVNLGAVNLSTDSLYIATDTDTVYHALADSTLPDGYQWTLQIDAWDETGYVVADNLSLTTALIATDTGQDKGFKETPKYKKFPDWR